MQFRFINSFKKVSKNSKKTLATLSLTGCGGCLFELTQPEYLNEKVGRFFDILDIKQLSNPELDRIDLAVIEGYPQDATDIKLLQKIRAKSDFVLIIGSCAINGGIEKLKAKLPKKILDSDKIKKIPDIIRIDGFVLGCPPQLDEIENSVMDVFWDKIHRLPDLAVCFECKQNGNECLLRKNHPCLGPITSAGCNSICLNYGGVCIGCRDNKSDSNFEKMQEIIKSLSEKPFDPFDITESKSKGHNV